MAVELKDLAILWDMDGVLVDTTDLHFYTWQAALNEHDYEVSWGDFIATFGKNSHSALEMLFGDRIFYHEAKEIIERKESLFQELAPDRVNLLPDVRAWLARFRQGGAVQAVASSAPYKNIEVLVDALDIRGFFKALVSGSELPPKPNPDVFLVAAEELGMPPARCVVIEDAVHGVEGAKAAGMKCVAVTTTNSAGALHAADLVLGNLTALTAEKLLALFG